MLPTIKIKDFSCIDFAEIQISELTILIGPQASGKSVISKLAYFFLEIIESTTSAHFDEPEPTEKFLKSIGEQFKKWFPSIAWGKKKFEVLFSIGPIEIKVSRTAFNKSPSQNVKIAASEAFVEFYQKLVLALREVSGKRPVSKDEFQIRGMEEQWRILGNARKELAEITGKGTLENQLFIPAGRSFFTSFGDFLISLQLGLEDYLPNLEIAQYFMYQGEIK
jgi:hypothetical protein